MAERLHTEEEEDSREGLKSINGVKLLITWYLCQEPVQEVEDLDFFPQRSGLLNSGTSNIWGQIIL